jgi:type IV pilus assembly protein PilV
MLNNKNQNGFTLIELLITMVIMAFGMLSLAVLQIKTHASQLESYQRSQAIVLVQNMTSLIQANRSNAASYVTGLSNPLGTGDSQPSSCSGVAFGSARDQCEWSNSLKGAAEQKTSSNVGSILGARGCIELIQAENSASGICQPGIYRVNVAWQGLGPSVAPVIACGKDLYGSDANRRLVSSLTTIGTPTCN